MTTSTIPAAGAKNHAGKLAVRIVARGGRPPIHAEEFFDLLAEIHAGRPRASRLGSFSGDYLEPAKLTGLIDDRSVSAPARAKLADFLKSLGYIPGVEYGGQPVGFRGRLEVLCNWWTKALRVMTDFAGQAIARPGKVS